MGTTGTEGGGVKERVVAMVVVVVVGGAARLLCSVVVVMAVDHHLDFWMSSILNKNLIFLYCISMGMSDFSSITDNTPPFASHFGGNSNRKPWLL